MSCSQVKPVLYSLVIVGFSLDEINILQHIKHLFSTIALAPVMIDGMNMVHTTEMIIECELKMRGERDYFHVTSLNSLHIKHKNSKYK